MFIKRDDAQTKTYGALALHDIMHIVDAGDSLCFSKIDIESHNLEADCVDVFQCENAAMVARFIQMKIEAKTLNNDIEFNPVIEGLNNIEEYFYWQYSANNTPLKMTLLNAHITFKYRAGLTLQSLLILASAFNASLYNGDKKVELVQKKQSICKFLGF